MLHPWSQLPYPTRRHTWPYKSFIIKKMLEGFRRSKPSIDCRSPITLPLFRTIPVLPHICKNTLFAPAFQLAYFGLFRVGEITWTTRNSSEKIVSLGDLTLTPPGSMTIKLRYYKTDRIGKGTIITIPHSPDSTPCYQTLLRFLAMRQKSDLSAPLFIHMDKTPITVRVHILAQPYFSGHWWKFRLSNN